MSELELTSPWGNQEILLDDGKCKVKKITVHPGARLSYQSHEKRAEIWVIISGTGKVTLDEHESLVGPNAVMGVPVNAKHRIENILADEDLVFIETQIGTYFGEDDIIRFDDDYGRHQDNWADVDADLL